MGMIDDLKKECQCCCREIDASGLEAFRCTNKTVIKTRDSSWCYPKNADMPCSTCEYCCPKQEMEMTIDKAITKYKNNAEFERTHGNLQGCLEFRQLAKWLEELRTYRKLNYADNVDNCLREKVVDNGNDDR